MLLIITSVDDEVLWVLTSMIFSDFDSPK